VKTRGYTALWVAAPTRNVTLGATICPFRAGSFDRAPVRQDHLDDTRKRDATVPGDRRVLAHRPETYLQQLRTLILVRAPGSHGANMNFFPDTRETMSDQKKDPGPDRTAKRWLPFVIAILLVLLPLLVFQFFRPGGEIGSRSAEVSYTEFKTLVARDQVTEVHLRGPTVTARLRAPQALRPGAQPAASVETRVPAVGDSELLPLLERHAVVVYAEPESTGIGATLIYMLPWIVLIALIWMSWRRAQRLIGGGVGPGSQLERFLQGTAKKAEAPKVTFADVAGQENAKREVQELVDYLRDPERFRKLGADVPRGVLLMGPPGTGKTLLARALAGEAGVPFYSISGSEFIEVFVGVGASRVRHLFETAKKNAPSIVFIDELDAVGRTRGTGLGGGHDEREQTLNQVLAEMDGFQGHEAVIVLAATNRPDVLDPALLRPGRFDRHVTLDLPDRKERAAILAVHTRKVPLAAGVDFDHLAGITPGFSGADLKNLVNEAAILAARENATRVTMRHFDEGRNKVILGSARSLAIEPDERHRLAVHEAGHAVVAYFLPHADPLYRVSIIPRGRALGGTQQLPERERYTLPEEYLRARLAVMLGGRTAERDKLASVSSGADDDIRQATALARAMVSRWGMSDEIGPVDLRDSEEHPFLGREMAMPRRFSESSAQRVDQAVHDLLRAAEESAAQTLRENGGALDRLIQALEQEEDLERNRIETILGPRPQVATSAAARPAAAGG
jgi:cell division protease FtsH